MGELTQVIDDLGRTFEEFKKTNDQRLQEIEKKGASDPILDEKLAKLNERMAALDEIKSRIDGMETKINRPGNAGFPSEKDKIKAEHKEAFRNFVRKGNEVGLKDLEMKAVNIGTPGEGGYAVPEEIDRMVYDLLVDISPMRSICNRVQVGTSDWKKLVNTRGTASGWVGEATARTETATSGLAEVAPPMGEIYANPAATQWSLDDMFFDVEQWISNEVSVEFAKEEGLAFISGNGTNKPKGILAYTSAATADSARAFGTIEHLATGVAGGWAASNPSDVLITLVYKLKAGLRRNARFVTNKALLAEIRAFKDGQGQYLWQPGLQQGQPSMLLGYPVVEAEDMPAKATDSKSLAFGDFRAGYTIVDRVGLRTLRDPFTNKPYVHFYTTKRLGGAIIDSEAIKVLKFGTA